jgi:hypothetical protein
MARESLADAVDCLTAALALTAGPDTTAVAVDFGTRASAYAGEMPRPSWLAGVQNDAVFIETLIDEVDAWQPSALVAQSPHIEQYGAGDVFGHVSLAARNLHDSVARTTLGALLNLSRAAAHRSAAGFIGDVFKYLDMRGKLGARAPIIQAVSSAFDEASRTRRAGDQCTVVVAHSMGGNIAYDVLSAFRTDFECDLLVTVGSQVGLFEELKLFQVSDESIPSRERQRVARLPNVKRWLNVFDPLDALGYAVERIFEGAEDFEFSTGRSPLSAHGMYFLTPSFHRQLSRRLNPS